MPSDYYKINTKDQEELYKAAKKLEIAAWSDHCDLDYWITDMTSGKPCNIPKNVLKMAMKHLSKDLYDIAGLLAKIKEDNFKNEYIEL